MSKIPTYESEMSRDDILDGLLRLSYAFGSTLVDKIVFWHTHPHGRVGPSSKDVEARAEISEYECLVVAIPTGEAVMY